MTTVVFTASLLAAVLAVLPASAAPAFQEGPRQFADAREAQRTMPPAPARCATAGACVATLLPLNEPDGLRWVGFWADPTMRIECVDSATAAFRVDCDASDAVRVVVPPARETCVVAADRSGVNCTPEPRPDRPYRPGPGAG